MILDFKHIAPQYFQDIIIYLEFRVTCEKIWPTWPIENNVCFLLETSHSIFLFLDGQKFTSMWLSMALLKMEFILHLVDSYLL